MKIVLIIPDRPYLINQKALPPLSILYVSAFLKRLGHEVTVLDFADGWKFIDGDVYGISIVTADFLNAVKILNFLKRKGARRVICGGIHASLMPQKCLKAGFDGVNIGDGETVNLISLLSSGKTTVGWLKNIDDAPHPDRTALNLHDYCFQIKGVDATSLLTARGCVWGKCAFCSRSTQNVRFHSAKYVIEELEEIRSLGFNAVAIYDDEFFVYPRRDLKIVETLGEMGFTWRSFAKSNYVLKNRKVIETAGRNGLSEVLLGIESADNKILRIVEKGTTVEMNKETIKLLYDMGVNIKCAMICGLPGESEESLKRMESFCEEMSPYVADFDFTVLQVFPGSKIWNSPEKYDLFWQRGSWYKGCPNSYGKTSQISTSKISFKKIVDWRNRLERQFKPEKKIR